MSKIKIFSILTDSHQVLFDHYYSTSFPYSSCEMVIRRFDLKGKGDFGGEDFRECMRQKVKMIIDSVEENLGEVIFWSDVDIDFFDFDPHTVLEKMKSSSLELYFQNLNLKFPQACGGFYAIACSAKTKIFFEEVLRETIEVTNGNEQTAIHHILKSKSCSVKHALMGPEYYARTHGYPPPMNLAIHHATSLSEVNTVKQKVEQLEEVRWMMKSPQWRRPFLFLKNMPGALKRRYFSNQCL